jgi:hypothetical protein
LRVTRGRCRRMRGRESRYARDTVFVRTHHITFTFRRKRQEILRFIAQQPRSGSKAESAQLFKCSLNMIDHLPSITPSSSFGLLRDLAEIDHKWSTSSCGKDPVSCILRSLCPIILRSATSGCEHRQSPWMLCLVACLSEKIERVE